MITAFRCFIWGWTMKLCDKTVSLFNKVFDPATRAPAWNKTLLVGVSWYARDVSAVTGDGLKIADQYTVRIPNDAGYVPPGAYTGEGWTLQKGDYMALGDVEYTPTMQQTYGANCMTITSITDNRRARGKHFKVLGQ